MKKPYKNSNSKRSITLAASLATSLTPLWVGAWLLLGFISIFAWIFGTKADVISWRYGDELVPIAATYHGSDSTGITSGSNIIYRHTFPTGMATKNAMIPVIIFRVNLTSTLIQNALPNMSPVDLKLPALWGNAFDHSVAG